MRALSPSELLSVWERGQSPASSAAAIALLQAASPGVSAEELLDMPVGRRDALLLTLRECTFGARFDGVATCPACNELLEFCFSAADVRASAPSEPASSLRLDVAGDEWTFRMPTTRDLDALPADVTAEGAARWLLARCAVGEAELPPLSPESYAEISRSMGDADPQADVRIVLDCTACAHQWDAPFDIVAFFWRELDRHAQRLIAEVHALASRYGWCEADVLALSPLRRRLYIEMGAA